MSERGRRILAGLARTIFVVLLPWLLLLTTVLYVSFDQDVYVRLWDKHDVPAATGLAMAELADVWQQTFEYFAGLRDDERVVITRDGRPQQVYGEQATLHLIEVRDLYQRAFRWRDVGWPSVLAVLLAGVIFVSDDNAQRLRWLGRTLLGAALVAVLLAGVIVLAFVFDFHAYWDLFHQIFFDTDLWILPEGETMILMFPAGFFLDIILLIARWWLLQNAVLLVLGVWLARRGAPTPQPADHEREARV